MEEKAHGTHGKRWGKVHGNHGKDLIHGKDLPKEPQERRDPRAKARAVATARKEKEKENESPETAGNAVSRATHSMSARAGGKHQSIVATRKSGARQKKKRIPKA